MTGASVEGGSDGLIIWLFPAGSVVNMSVKVGSDGLVGWLGFLLGPFSIHFI